jgi:hypothetical protein
MRGRYWIVPILGGGAAIERATGQHHLTEVRLAARGSELNKRPGALL